MISILQIKGGNQMYLVSACLAGANCKYNGSNNENKNIISLVKQGKAIPICPEQLGGLPTPRISCEIVCQDGEKRVINKDGQDCTKEFVEGANKTLAVAKALGIDKAILQSRSPSCGKGLIYDGTFAGRLINGAGLTAELLLENGFTVLTDKEYDELMDRQE
jgi:uncharacterized protein YbbK (DUF523 family)